GQWMMQSTWGCTTSCNTSTPQGPMQGCCSWTSARRSTPSFQKSSSPNSPSSLCLPPTVSGSQTSCPDIPSLPELPGDLGCLDRKQQVRLGETTSSTRSIS